MATSAIGPGFLTQTTVFTQQLLASFGFVILLSILLDIGAQLNIWRVLTVSELRAQDIANKVLPGLGYFIAALIVLGGFVFNIANVGGSGLGLNVLTGVSVESGAVLSAGIAVLLFWVKEFGKALDAFAKILGVIMILLTAYVAVKAQPPLVEVAHRSFIPMEIDFTAIVTLVGGTVGGYISFAGAHRLLDAGIKGESNLSEVNRSAVSGIVVTGVMRSVLFLAVLGVVIGGGLLDPKNPAASVFQLAVGEIGYRIFGLVLWCAAITSIIGCAYTSISFLRSIHPVLEKQQRLLITLFIIISTIIFVFIGNPVKLLVSAGAINGFILPISLSVILIASRKSSIVKSYRHPIWMQGAGWIVVALMSWMSVFVLVTYFKG
ncbi:MAG: divalent metal cation transporter [Flammeovirgaceae bacterium]|nr:divalent metal cation transporter [Flammeovirgaceae bacterium]